ncbi:hypothetical protein C8R43DRAFT_1092224 [Mycena crocata]|nr:hypothetical protein C8R43DRAFT_1092224 [Mycena crocata]
MADVLEGRTRIEISHAGGEFGTLEEDIEEDSGEDDEEEKKRKAEDWRTRRDRTESRTRDFQGQMPEMIHEATREPAEEEIYDVDVVDMFETTSMGVSLDPTAGGVAPALVLEGLMPCAPWKPSVVIKIRVLEMYRVTHVRCPQLAVQAFVKSLCDIHGVAYRPYLCQQFSIAYDLYLDLRRRVDERLEGEDQLIFDMLTTMDGNDSLKRVLRREKTTMAEDEMGEPVLGSSKERVDNRDVSDGYILSRERVDRWAKTRLAAVLPMQSGNSNSDNPCADRWKNMVNDVTSKMWGIFDETGIFLALCRHGFVLVLADMLRSGELAKYPLAVVEELLSVFGMNIGAGYDVGCHFGTTVANSELGEEAERKNLRCLVGSFHGHAHNRLCQLSFLATYVEGMGLEDLEGCERFFSRSNGLARSCRYAGRFHRQQEITAYVKHFDSFETYANLSKFLVTNYRQALSILKTEPALVRWMRQEGVRSTDEFKQWLKEEREYLLGLKDAPKTTEETMEMEYVQKLVNLSASHKAIIAKRHAKEKVDRDLEAVEELEDMLLITERWTTTSPKWLATTVEIKKRRYQLALDALELLIVERIFELTKMNQSQTGYKMRKHIAKALQARSKAVRAAIDRYNAAAMLLDPPMPQLSWDQVVEYAFLADFDILRDTRAEVRARPWTRPSYRLAMDNSFKILRAREEIKRLNVEIPRVITWIRDENRLLRKKEAELRDTEGKSEDKVGLYRERRGRFDDQHMQRFWKLGGTPGFTGSLRPGVSVERRAAQRQAAAARAREARTEQRARHSRTVRVIQDDSSEDGMDVDEVVVVDAAGNSWNANGEGNTEWEDDDDEEMAPLGPLLPGEGSDEEDEGHRVAEERVSGLLYQISMMAIDGAASKSDEEA